MVMGMGGQKRDDAPLTRASFLPPKAARAGNEEEGGCSQREKTMGRRRRVEEEKEGKFRRCISPRRRATLRVNGGLERVRDSTRQPRLHLTEWNLSTVPWDVE